MSEGERSRGANKVRGEGGCDPPPPPPAEREADRVATVFSISAKRALWAVWWASMVVACWCCVCVIVIISSCSTSNPSRIAPTAPSSFLVSAATVWTSLDSSRTASSTSLSNDDADDEVTPLTNPPSPLVLGWSCIRPLPLPPGSRRATRSLSQRVSSSTPATSWENR